MNDDLTFNARTHENVDYVKGHTSEGIRYIPLTDGAKKILGHTTLAMTLHYLRDITPDNETMNQMCNILG